MPHPLVLGPLMAVPFAAVFAVTGWADPPVDDTLDRFAMWMVVFTVCFTFVASLEATPEKRMRGFEAVIFWAIVFHATVVILFATGPLGLILALPLGAAILLYRRRR